MSLTKAFERANDAHDIRALFDYDPDSGVLTWRTRLPYKGDNGASVRFNNKHAGQPALNHAGSGGYLCGTVDGVAMLAHRVAFCHHNGYWPEEVDHDDRAKHNNAADNLLDSSRRANCLNTHRSDHEFVGVDAHRDRWMARVGKTYLGLFDTREEARDARKEYLCDM